MMKNRIRHLLADWNPEVPAAEPAPEDVARPLRSRGGYPMPRGINMLMPVELCINRDLLVSLLSASIQEIHRHRRDLPDDVAADQDIAEMEAALQQQLAFRAWARSHPSSYICIALYPVAEAGSVEDLEEFGEF
jgi:hypothetical protein